MDALHPTTVDEVVAAVVSAPRVLAVGAGTKPRLAAVEAAKISMQRLAGIVEYEPSEYTVTAYAGTPVQDINATLKSSGQYLPFDPMLVNGGATLGGTVSAGINGPGRFRFGGIRDFILGVQWVDGAGRLLRFGGKVVKNAAGFDLPKFAVGGLGRFGVLTEITFKVFPRKPDALTIRLPAATVAEATDQLIALAKSQWELDALDYLPDQGAVFFRLCGLAAGLEPIANEIKAKWGGTTLSSEDAEVFWSTLREFRWAHDEGVLAKTVHSPTQLPNLCARCAEVGNVRIHTSCGGNASYVSLATAADAEAFYDKLGSMGIRAVTLRGGASLWGGSPVAPQIALDLKTALDPQNRFPDLDD